MCDYPFSAFRLYSWRLSSSLASSCALSASLSSCLLSSLSYPLLGLTIAYGSLDYVGKVTTFGKYIFQNVIPSHLKTNELIKYDTAMIPNTNNATMIPNTIRMKPRSINFSK